MIKLQKDLRRGCFTSTWKQDSKEDGTFCNELFSSCRIATPKKLHEEAGMSPYSLLIEQNCSQGCSEMQPGK